jgi:Domain of unknown function (DUF4365)
MRKRRTRGHIIEDLGFNHVERQVLLAGYTLQNVRDDYGYDGYIQTFNENGEIEQSFILMQLKSTDNLQKSENGDKILFDLSVRDLELWLSGREVMVLIIYDALNEKAFFIEMKDYFEKNIASLKNVRKFVRIYISTKNILTQNSIFELRKIKNDFHGNS